MPFSVTTWNINSVRLRIAQVQHFLEEVRPDVLCLQETKTPDDAFPIRAIEACGYPYIAKIGQKGYNGVAIVSRHAFAEYQTIAMCGRSDARHVSVRLGDGAGAFAGLDIHNFYVPAGGDVADPVLNPKFAHKLDFLKALDLWGEENQPAARPALLVGDLNIAPLEHDVWSHRQLLDVVSHTPIETTTLEILRKRQGWVDSVRQHIPEPEKVYTWWSYRSPDWAAANKGRRLDHIWASPHLARLLTKVSILREARGWERPSDHVPLTLTFG
jgi:exodeoxyribonuclease III